MANLRQRGGSVKVRVGGNTQDTATLVDSIQDGAALEKDNGMSTNPVTISVRQTILILSTFKTGTPPLIFTSEIIKMMAEISALTDVYWYMGMCYMIIHIL